MEAVRTWQMAWSWRGCPMSVGVDETGTGRTVLVLPAPSSVSTREEMRPLTSALAGLGRFVVPDWPGFGTLPKPQIGFAPQAFLQFLRDLVASEASPLHATIAAGHAASYALVQRFHGSTLITRQH